MVPGVQVSNLTAGNIPLAGAKSAFDTGGPYGAFEPLAVVTVGSGGASSISFQGIPATYKHLQLRGILKDQRGTGVLSNAYMQFNQDREANYANHNMYGDGGGGNAASESQTSMGSMLFANIASGTTNTGMFAAFISDILDYSSFAKYKTVRTLNGADNSGGGQATIKSGVWMNSSSQISSITITPLVANFVEFSQVALYGVK